MKTIVSVEIEIPDGYELAEPMMRRPVTGDTYLGINGEIREAGHLKYNNDYPILKKKWEPEKGKYYLFWHSCYKNLAQIRLFNLMRGKIYVDMQGGEWDNCEPIPKEMIGE